MKASIDLSAVADQLAECKPGDEYSLVFVVETKTDKGLTGSASEIEHVGDDYEDEAPVDERMPHGMQARSGGRKVPKAILMVAK